MKILVGVDGSSHADRALSWALQMASLQSASLTVLHAYRVGRFSGGSDADEQAATELVAKALDRAAGHADPSGIDVETTAVTGRGAAEAILRHAEGLDLIVVGSRGRGGFAELLLGSVSQQVAAHADVPVAVIPRLPTGDLTDETDVRRPLVVGVDGSRSSMHALRWAAQDARARDVGLSVVYAYQGLRGSAPHDALASLDDAQVRDLERQATQTASRKLRGLLDGVAELKGMEVHRQVVAGSPSRVLIEQAGDADSILVVGSRGHGGFTGLLLGSVSHQCIQHARGPVVVTPAVR